MILLGKVVIGAAVAWLAMSAYAAWEDLARRP